MNIAIGNDRQGLSLKKELVIWLQDRGHEVVNVGTNIDEPCDYPIYAERVATLLSEGTCSRGIVICATGIGISIAANKFAGIRCGLAYDDEVTRLMRQHNDANMIAFGQRFMSAEDVKRRLEIFLSTGFSGGHHQERISQITKIEEKQRSIRK